MTAAGPIRRCGGICDTSSRSRPVIQWIGASTCVPTCSPPSNQFQYQAGPRSSYRLISCIFQPGVLANGGGSWIVGVASDRGWVRSTTSTDPDLRACTSEERASIVGSFLLSRPEGPGGLEPVL